MASPYAVAIAAIFQIVFRVSFFITQSSDMCSKAPTLASWIFLISFLDVLLDLCIYPVRYMHLPWICQFMVETLATVLLTEFGSLMVWCKIEEISCKLCKSLLLVIGMSPDFYYAWQDYILGAATTSISISILLFVGQATDHFHFMHKRSMRMCRKINLKLLRAWTKLHSMLVKGKYTNNENETICGETESYDLTSDVFYQATSKNNRRNRRQTRKSRSRNRR